MLELYTGMLVTGILFAVVTVLLGDVLGHALSGMFDWMSGDVLQVLQPMVLFSAITVMGGTGLLLTRYSALGTGIVLASSGLAAAVSSVFIYFLYVKPMGKADNSVAFSMNDLVGRIGEVSVPIPSKGCGEVIFRIGGGLTNQIAESFEGMAIPAGTKVVGVEVRDGVLSVTLLETNPW